MDDSEPDPRGVDLLPLRLPEPLYTRPNPDLRPTGKKLFDYVDPANRALQLENEAITHCTP